MRLEILGASGGIGPGRRTTALRVDEDLLIDAGSGVGELSLEAMARVRHVFLTHSHLDHVAFLPFLLDSVFDRLEGPVTVHGLPETLEALRRHLFNWVLWPDFARLPDPGRPVLRYRPMGPGETREVGGRRLTLLPVAHAVPAAGYVVTGPSGGCFAFSGDTSLNEGFWEGLNALPRLDLLIVETAFPDSEEALCRLARHYCPALLAEDLARLRHRPRLLVTHAKPGAEALIDRQCRERLPHLAPRLLRGGEVFEL